MPYTPFGDKSPWESLATRNQRVREEEQEKEKLRKRAAKFSKKWVDCVKEKV